VVLVEALPEEAVPVEDGNLRISVTLISRKDKAETKQEFFK